MEVTQLGRRRAALVPVVIAGLSMLGPFSIDTPFPAFASIQHDFGVGAETTQQLVSAYLLAFGAMSVFHGPISDAIGRRPVMLGGLAVYGLASLGCLLAPSMGVLISMRVLQGLAAGGSVIIARTVVRDLYDGPAAQKLMSTVTMIFGLAPAVAPVLGGWILGLGSWRVIFAFLVVLAIVLTGALVVVLPETHPADRRTPFRPRPLLAGLVSVARSGRFQVLSLAGTFMFGGYFLYIGSAAIVVVDLLGGGETDFWWLFVPLIGGMIGGSWISGRSAGRGEVSALITAAFVVAIGGALLNVALAATSATAQMPWAVVGPFVIGVGVGMGYPNLQLAVLDLFPERRGSAASVTTFQALVLNAIGAGVLAPFVTRSLLVLALCTLGYVLVGALLWVVHRRVVSA